jgi:hypothetical protein
MVSATMRKAVGEVITNLKKLPEPGKKTGSFWNFMKGQLLEESEWDQRHIKTIEKEIDSYLSKVDKKTLIEMWKATPQGEEKFDEDKKFDVKEMKTDIIDEMVGQVMDKMDDNYSSRDSFYPSAGSETYQDNGKKSLDVENSDDNAEPDDIPDDDIPLDDDLFNEDMDEDDDYKF